MDLSQDIIDKLEEIRLQIAELSSGASDLTIIETCLIIIAFFTVVSFFVKKKYHW